MMSCVGDQRVLCLGLYFALGCLVAGYHSGILVFQLSNPDWKSELNHPGAAVVNTIICVFYVGAIVTCLFVSPLVSDRLGRRYACVIGIVVTSIGAAFQACSLAPNGVAMMLVGRAIVGSGIAIVVTAVPMYLTEIARPKMRGFVVGMCQLGFIVGMVAGEWVSYTLAFWTTELVVLLGWRIAVMIQCIPAFIFGVGLPFLPESPRWLSESGTPDIARATLTWLREGVYSPIEVEDELSDIQYTTAQYSGSTTLSLFTDKPLRVRLVCAFLLQFTTQLCGMAAIRHYLPVLLETLGYKLQQGMKYMVVEEASKVLFTLLGMVLVDRVGRKTCLMVGCVAMAFGMLTNAIMPMIWPIGSNVYSDKACILAIVIFGIGYSIGLGTVSWVYSTEIFPTSLRSRAVNIAACGSALGSISMIGVWPVTGTRANPKLYFVFAGLALILVPFFWLRLPETKNRALEDMNALFGKSSVRFHRIHDADENEDIEIGVVDCDSDSDVDARSSDETYVEVPETSRFLQGDELK